MPAESVSGGGALSFDQFFNAIAQQESGGNYGAVNPRTGASGKYQIMPGNIGPWSQQYLGRRVSVARFRSSPQLQDQLARAVLEDYFNKWGPRGAAAAWYSGSPKKADNYNRFRSNEPSVGEYVDQVLGRMGVPSGSSPGVPSSGGGFQVADASFAPDGQGVDDLTIQPDSMGRVFDQQASAVPGVAVRGSDPTRDKILTEAMRYIGTPYVWGGTSPKGFDCSGLIQYVYGKYGLDLPRISADQANFGSRTDVGDLRPGDLVAWDNSGRNAGADHIAIYAGDGYIIEAPHAGASVRRRKLGSNEGAWGVSLGI